MDFPDVDVVDGEAGAVKQDGDGERGAEQEFVERIRGGVDVVFDDGLFFALELIGSVFAVLCQLALTWGILMSIALYILFTCILFMFLEAAVGFCAGCWFYGLLPPSWTARRAEAA